MRRARLIILAASFAMSAIAVACVLADPPPIANPPVLEQPSILTASVSPPLDQKIVAPPTSTPLVFSIPVQISIDQTFSYRVFIDLDSTSSQTPDKLIDVTQDGGIVGLTPDADTESVRALGFELPSGSFDFSICHSFTFVVAYSFFDNESSKPALNSPGAAQITWFYEPIADCTYYDAGPPTFEASDDGADE